MSKFKVDVIETLQMRVEVEAKSLADAVEQVRDAYHDGTYILDADNSDVSVDFQGLDENICKTCNKPLKIVDDVQSGYYCCDEYYCSKACLDKSFKGQTTWKDHFSQDGDCYWTEWNLA